MRVMRPLTFASTAARIFARTVPITSSVTGCGFASIVSTRTVTTGGDFAPEICGSLEQLDRPRATLAARREKTRITPLHSFQCQQALNIRSPDAVTRSGKYVTDW